MIARFAFLSALGLMLAGCQTTGQGSIKGGECRVFERPEFAVRGKQQYDQDWIDGNIEAGIGGCNWKRPSARPASLDGAPGQKVAAPVKAKKRDLIKRIKDRVVSPFTHPVAPILETPVVPTPPPPAKPRDPVDELLQPSK